MLLIILTLLWACLSDPIDFNDEKIQEAYQSTIVKFLNDKLIGLSQRSDVHKEDPVARFIDEDYFGSNWPTETATITNVYWVAQSSQKNIVCGNVKMTFTDQNALLVYNLTQNATFTFGPRNHIRSVSFE